MCFFKLARELTIKSFETVFISSLVFRNIHEIEIIDFNKYYKTF